MYLEDKEYYWYEMSHHTYPVLSQAERLELEYKEQEFYFLEKCYDIEKCVKFIWGEE